MSEVNTSQAQAAEQAPEFVVSISPHVRSRESVPKIMWTVIACLIPPLILAAVLFGARVLMLAAVSVLSCIAVEALCQKLMKRPIRIKDGSAVLTGLLLVYVLPPGVSPTLPILGAVMAMFIGKQLMGGLGYNIFNPALLARAFLMVSFPVAMTSAWISPAPLEELGAAGQWIAALNSIDAATGATPADAVTGATPLMLLTEQNIDTFHAVFGSGPGVYGQFFIGYKPGCIGEVSGFLLLLGGLFLIWKKYITWHIPVSMLGMIAFLTWIFGGKELFSGDPLLGVLSGGAILGAFFMATDYVTSPSNRMSQIIFGMAIGAITVLIRLKGGYPEGVCYAILLMNPLSTVLDGWFKRRRFSPQPHDEEKNEKTTENIEKSETPAEKTETPAENSEKTAETPAEKTETPAENSEKTAEKPAETAEKSAEKAENPSEKAETPSEKVETSENPSEKAKTPSEKAENQVEKAERSSLLPENSLQHRCETDKELSHTKTPQPKKADRLFWGAGGMPPAGVWGSAPLTSSLWGGAPQREYELCTEVR